MKIKAVIFDLFETLVSECSEGDRTSSRDFPYMDFLGISNEDFQEAWNERRQQRMAGYFPDYPSTVKDILDNAGLRYHRETVHYLFDKRIEEKRRPFITIRPDLMKLLAKLRGHGLKLGLISNCSEEEVRGWEACELAPYFDQVVFSYQVKLTKPDVRIYELACEQLSVLPEEAVYIGDGGSGELTGARQAGLTAYQALWFKNHAESEYKNFALPLEVLRELDLPKETTCKWLIREVQIWEVDAFWQLRLEALRVNPEAFGALYEDSIQDSMTQVIKRIRNDDDQFILGAFTEDERMVAMVGFRGEQASKLKHKAVIWGMYVTPDFRGQGIAKALLIEVLTRGKKLSGLKQINLSVVTSNFAAYELYKSLGFEVFGVEKDALMHQGQGYDEHHMVFRYT